MAGPKTDLQKKVADGRRQKPENIPDLTDFMNDMFFGTVQADKKAYNLSGREGDADEDDFESSTRSNSSSRQTQEWLEQARRLVAASPARCDSPSRLVGSPRFAAAAEGRLSLSSQLDRRDPLSRSARRHRASDGFSGEILTKSAKHGRNRSETLDIAPDSPTADSPPPVSSAHRWFSNVAKPPNDTSAGEPTSPVHVSEQAHPPQLLLPPRQSAHNRRSRFQNDPAVAQPPAQGIFSPSPGRKFRASVPAPDGQPLSPPRNLVESAHRRSISSTTCSVPDDGALSPPRGLVESAHRRSASSSTCSVEKIAPPRQSSSGSVREGEWVRGSSPIGLNVFLKEQRSKIGKLLDGEINAKAKIVLSGPSNSTSSMVAAICYAWLLENRMSNNRAKDGGDRGYVVAPVMNVKRSRMWKHRQAAWLFHHVGLDPSSLLFADEVDLESLMMAGRLNIIVAGQDVLQTNNEVGSQCTILTDNYCEEAYDLLQTALLKKLLLAGLLLDTQNLNPTAKLYKTRDAEAVQLMLVGSAPNYRNALYDQLMQDPRDSAFVEVLHKNYGKPPSETFLDKGALAEQRAPERKSTSVHNHQPPTRSPNTKSSEERNGRPIKSSPRPDNKENATPAEAPTKASIEPTPPQKNTFFLAKWFGFGRK